MSPKLDNKVMVEFQEGKQTALKRVFERYYPILFDFANRLIEHSGEAEDITLVAFHKLFNISSQFETETNLKAFLYIAVRNSCLTYLKLKRSRSEHQKLFAEKMKNDVLLQWEYEIKEDLYDRVINAIEDLPEECRKIFKLLFIDQLKPSEVAEILKITTSTVYNQKQNALKALRLKFRGNSLVLAFILHILISAQKAGKFTL